MNKINKLNVYYHDTLVGTLAKLNNGKIAFDWKCKKTPFFRDGTGILPKSFHPFVQDERIYSKRL